MLSLKIALRYLLAKKSHNAVNVISVISIAGVAVATMAIVVVLSVFNGFHDLAAGHLSKIDPQLMAVPTQGKTFASADSLATALESLPEVSHAMPSLTERGLLMADSEQMPVIFKGIDFDKYPDIGTIEELLVDGVFASSGITDSVPAMEVAVGPAVKLRMRPTVYPIARLYVPRRVGRINPANPAASYRGMDFAVSGVFQVNQPEYDGEYLLIPLDRARELLDYSSSEASAIEIALQPDADESRAVAAVQEFLGDGFLVRTRLQQQEEAFRMISVEKWVTFLMMVFILAIASFNIISTLSLLVIEKRDNMLTLRSLGAQPGMLRGIFVAEGWLITAVGGLAGTIAGVILALLQEHFGFIKLSGDPSALTIDTYPVHVETTDVLLVAAAVLILGAIIGQISRIFTRNI